MSNYLSLPGVAGEYASVPDTNLLDADMAHTYQSVGGWTVSGVGAAAAVSADFPGTMGYAAKVSGATNGDVGVRWEHPTADYVSVGNTYTVSFRMRFTKQTSARVFLAEMDGNTQLSNTQIAAETVYSAGQWYTISVNYTTTDAAVKWLRPRLYDTVSPTVGNVAYYTDAFVALGSDLSFVPSLRISGDTFEAEITMETDWGNPPAGAGTAGVFNGRGQNASPVGLFRFNKFVDGTKRWYVGVRGSDGVEAAPSVAYPSDWVAGEYHTIKMTADGATTPGSVIVRLLYDGVDSGGSTYGSWAGFGPTVAEIGIGAYHDGTVPYAAPTKIKSAVIRDGIDGPVICRTDFTNVTPSELEAASFTSDEGHTVTLNGDEWAYVRPVTSGILSRAELLLQADDGNEGNSPKWADRSGNDHHAQLGSAAGSDTSDPEYLGNEDGDHVRLPGVAGNYVSSADVNLLDADTAHLHQSIGGWTSANGMLGQTTSTDLAPKFGDSHGRITAVAGSGRALASSTYWIAGSGVPVSAAADYAAEVWFAVTEECTSDVTFTIVFTNGSGANLGTGGSGATQVSPVAGQWYKLTTSGTAPAGAAYATLQVASGTWTDTGYLYFDKACLRAGSDGTFVPSLRIVGDLDLRAKVALTDVAGSGVNAILGRYVSTTALRHFTFGIDNTAKPKLGWYETGGAAQAKTASTAMAAGDGEATELRVTLDLDDGASDCDVTFYENGVQLGSVQSVGSTSSLRGAVATAAEVGAIYGGTVDLLDGNVYWAEVRDGIDGPVVARYDAADAEEPFATQTGSVDGRTWTYNRSGSGLYVVDRPSFGLHTDDFFEVADHANLDFAADEDFTLLVAVRTAATPASNDRMVDKWNGTEGYVLSFLAANATSMFLDGATAPENLTGGPAVTTRTLGVVAGRRDADGDVSLFLDGGGEVSSNDDSAGSLANAVPLRIGSRASVASNYLDGEVMAVALFREALTDDEIAAAGAALLGGSAGRLLLLGVG